MPARTNSGVWGTGNPVPDYYGEDRKGDNLYTESVVALDADTGKLKWYFQHLPRDNWDMDHVFERMIVTTSVSPSPDEVRMNAAWSDCRRWRSA